MVECLGGLATCRGFLFGTNPPGSRYIGMNIVEPVSEITIDIIARPWTPGEFTNEWIVVLTDKETNSSLILANPGRETNVIVSQQDPDGYLSLTLMLPEALKERHFYSLFLYAISTSISSELEGLLDALELSPTGDAFLSLKSAIDLCHTPPTIELLYRGVVYCTSQPGAGVYRPTEGHFTVIEKTKRTYKTR